MSSITCFLLALSLLSVNAVSIYREKQIKNCKLDKWTEDNYGFEFGRFKAKRNYTIAKEICTACDGYIVPELIPAEEILELANNEPFWVNKDFSGEMQNETDDSADETDDLKCLIIRPNKNEPEKLVSCSKSKVVICMRPADAGVSTPDNTTDASSNTTESASDFKHTTILVHFETQPGDYVFIRGGLNGKNCNATAEDDNPCVIPMKTYSQPNMTANYTAAYDAWREGDNFLDWYGKEKDQGEFEGISARGTPAIWTTNDKTSEAYHESNNIGPHYWLLEADLDCSRTENGYFEFKAYFVDLNKNEGHWNWCEQENVRAKCGTKTVVRENGC